MLTLRAAPLALETLDALDAPELVAFVAEDERPLGGLAGYCDWRMCGALSRQVKGGAWRGAAGEAVLTVPFGRLPAKRLFLFGVGPKAKLSEEAAAKAVADGLARVAKAGGADVAASGIAGQPLAATARALVEAALAAKLSRLCLLSADPKAAHAALEAAAAGKAAKVEAEKGLALREKASVVR